MSLLRDIFGGQPATPETQWLQQTADALNTLANNTHRTRRSNPWRKYPDTYRRIAEIVDLQPDDLITELVNTLCNSLPDTLISKWESDIVRVPDSHVLFGDSNVEHRLTITVSEDHAHRALPEWFDANMRERVDRLIKAVRDTIQVKQVDLPRMREELSRFETDFYASQHLTGDDPAGELQRQILRDRTQETAQQVHDMTASVLDTLRAFRAEVHECRNLDAALAAAERLAAFQPAAEVTRTLDPSALEADTQQSQVRAVRLKGAVRSVQEKTANQWHR